GLFEPRPQRPYPIAVRAFQTMEYRDLAAIIDAFSYESSITGTKIGAACFGVAGPVLGEKAKLTNIPWTVESAPLAARFGFTRVDLLNDLQAMAYGVPVLDGSEI